MVGCTPPQTCEKDGRKKPAKTARNSNRRGFPANLAEAPCKDRYVAHFGGIKTPCAAPRRAAAYPFATFDCRDECLKKVAFLGNRYSYKLPATPSVKPRVAWERGLPSFFPNVDFLSAAFSQTPPPRKSSVKVPLQLFTR